jgi:hypothetical protein
VGFRRQNASLLVPVEEAQLVTLLGGVQFSRRHCLRGRCRIESTLVDGSDGASKNAERPDATAGRWRLLEREMRDADSSNLVPLSLARGSVASGTKGRRQPVGPGVPQYRPFLGER